VSDREGGSPTTPPFYTAGIYLTDVSASDGSDRATKLANGGDPAWSPDGTKLAYSDSGNIYVINADGTGAVKLTTGTEGDVHPAWSPDGARLAFARWPYDDDNYGNSDIWVMNSDGSGVRNLTLSHGASFCNWAPAWSADGQRIAFVGGQMGYVFQSLEGPANIYVMKTDGTGLRQLTTSPVGQRNLNPVWGPGGPGGGPMARATGSEVGGPVVTVGPPRAPASHEATCYGWW
jgi:TolB protein